MGQWFKCPPFSLPAFLCTLAQFITPQPVISELQFYTWGQGPGKPYLCCCGQHSKGHLSQQTSVSRALLVALHCFLCVHLYSLCWCLSWASSRTQLFLSVVAQQQAGSVLNGLHCAKAKTADGKCIKKKRVAIMLTSHFPS